MCTLLLSTTCRVCLASDREMYRLLNTPLEETYERVTSGTLAVEGRPCCVCGVCLSALRRCRRFIDTAWEANDMLDRWIRNHPNTDTLKLPERPLFSLTRRVTELIEIMSQGIRVGVKQESDMAESEDYKMIYQNEDTSLDEGTSILTEAIKFEITNDDGNDPTHVSDDEADETQMSDNIEGRSSVFVSDFECVNIQEEMIKVENDTPMLDELKCDIPEVLDNVGGGTTPGTSNVGSLRSGKRIKLNEDIKSGRALKKRRPITSEHRRGNTDPAPTLHSKINKKFYLCLQCSYKTAKSSHMIEHLKIHTGDKQFKCNNCDYKCSQKSRLNQHLLTHNGIKRFTCDKCDYESNIMSYLKQHSRSHTDNKPFACDKCDYKSRDIANFRRHSKQHTGEKPFSCNMCDYKCIQKSSLKKHLLNHSDQPSVCHICNFKCKSKYSLMNHLKTHTEEKSGEKPYTCDKCDYKTVKTGNLKKHLMTHTGEKPFQCDKCDFKCVQKGYLKQHSMTHTGEKPFRCDRCGYKCTQKVNLIRHLRTHTGEKPFACDKCDYKSIDIGNFRRHLKQHTGEKPFACDICDYKASQKVSLQQHLRTHTGEKPYICDKCYFKCCDKRHLIRHMMKVHATCI